jgi:hypothetical protein
LSVVRDYRPSKAEGSISSGTPAGKWENRLDFFLLNRRQEAVLEKLPANEKYSMEFEDMMALENSLQVGIDHKLSDFKISQTPQKNSDVRVRYFMNADDLPRELCTDFGCSMRVCIEDTATGARSLEVNWSNRMASFEWMDMGPGYKSRFWLYGPGQLRGAHFRDPCHRMNNTWNSSVSMTPGLSMVFHETSFVFAFRRGVWTPQTPHVLGMV